MDVAGKLFFWVSKETEEGMDVWDSLAQEASLQQILGSVDPLIGLDTESLEFVINDVVQSWNREHPNTPFPVAPSPAAPVAPVIPASQRPYYSAENLMAFVPQPSIPLAPPAPAPLAPAPPALAPVPAAAPIPPVPAAAPIPPVPVAAPIPAVASAPAPAQYYAPGAVVSIGRGGMSDVGWNDLSNIQSDVVAAGNLGTPALPVVRGAPVASAASAAPAPAAPAPPGRSATTTSSSSATSSSDGAPAAAAAAVAGCCYPSLWRGNDGGGAPRRQGWEAGVLMGTTLATAAVNERTGEPVNPITRVCPPFQRRLPNTHSRALPASCLRPDCGRTRRLQGRLRRPGRVTDARKITADSLLEPANRVFLAGDGAPNHGLVDLDFNLAWDPSSESVSRGEGWARQYDAMLSLEQLNVRLRFNQARKLYASGYWQLWNRTDFTRASATTLLPVAGGGDFPFETFWNKYVTQAQADAQHSLAYMPRRVEGDGSAYRPLDMAAVRRLLPRPAAAGLAPVFVRGWQLLERAAIEFLLAIYSLYYYVAHLGIRMRLAAPELMSATATRIAHIRALVSDVLFPHARDADVIWETFLAGAERMENFEQVLMCYAYRLAPAEGASDTERWFYVQRPAGVLRPEFFSGRFQRVYCEAHVAPDGGRMEVFSRAFSCALWSRALAVLPELSARAQAHAQPFSQGTLPQFPGGLIDDSAFRCAPVLPADRVPCPWVGIPMMTPASAVASPPVPTPASMPYAAASPPGSSGPRAMSSGPGASATPYQALQPPAPAPAPAPALVIPPVAPVPTEGDTYVMMNVSAAIDFARDAVILQRLGPFASEADDVGAIYEHAPKCSRAAKGLCRYVITDRALRVRRVTGFVQRRNVNSSHAAVEANSLGAPVYVFSWSALRFANRGDAIGQRVLQFRGEVPPAAAA